MCIFFKIEESAEARIADLRRAHLELRCRMNRDVTAVVPSQVHSLSSSRSLWLTVLTLVSNAGLRAAWASTLSGRKKSKRENTKQQNFKRDSNTKEQKKRKKEKKKMKVTKKV